MKIDSYSTLPDYTEAVRVLCDAREMLALCFIEDTNGRANLDTTLWEADRMMIKCFWGHETPGRFKRFQKKHSDFLDRFNDCQNRWKKAMPCMNQKQFESIVSRYEVRSFDTMPDYELRNEERVVFLPTPGEASDGNVYKFLNFRNKKIHPIPDKIHGIRLFQNSKGTLDFSFGGEKHFSPLDFMLQNQAQNSLRIFLPSTVFYYEPTFLITRQPCVPHPPPVKFERLSQRSARRISDDDRREASIFLTDDNKLVLIDDFRVGNAGFFEGEVKLFDAGCYIWDPKGNPDFAPIFNYLKSMRRIKRVPHIKKQYEEQLEIKNASEKRIGDFHAAYKENKKTFPKSRGKDDFSKGSSSIIIP